MPISDKNVVLHKWWKYDFFRFSKKLCKKFSFWWKNQLLLNWNVPSLALSCSGEQREQFEDPFEVLAQLEFEKSLKNHAESNFSGKIEKKHKSVSRERKNPFLPNKKHFSVVHDGIRNFLRCGPEDLFLTSPLLYVPS